MLLMALETSITNKRKIKLSVTFHTSSMSFPSVAEMTSKVQFYQTTWF